MPEIPKNPFRWSDLSGLDIPEFTMRRWLQDGRVRRVLTNVYCPGDLPDDLTTRAACAAVVLPDAAVLCDRSAAWLWGVDALEPDERFEPPDLEVAVADPQSRVRRRGVRGVRRDLAPSEIVRIGPVRVTTPVRTALDLACRRGRWRALAVLDGFMRTCDVTTADMTSALSRFGGRRGVTQARELVPLANGLAESPGESWTRGAIMDAGLSAPVLQFEVDDDGMLVRLDHAYPRWRIAVEYDGEEFHGEDRAQHDEDRRDWLRSQGWHVIVVRKHQFAGHELDRWLGELARVIESRSRKKVRYARRAEPWAK